MAPIFSARRNNLNAQFGSIQRQPTMDQDVNQSTADDVKICVVTEADKERVFEFLKENFYEDEPLTMSLEPGKPDINDFKYMISHVAHGTCLMALMENEIVGVALTSPKGPDEAEQLFELAKKEGHTHFGTVTKLLAHMEREANIFEKFQVDRVLHGQGLALHKKMRCRGLGARLHKEVYALARKKGFPVFTADCTSAYSQRICEKMGMECVNTIYYRDYLNDKGEQVFRPPEPHICISTYAIRL